MTERERGETWSWRTECRSSGCNDTLSSWISPFYTLMCSNNSLILMDGNGRITGISQIPGVFRFDRLSQPTHDINDWCFEEYISGSTITSSPPHIWWNRKMGFKQHHFWNHYRGSVRRSVDLSGMRFFSMSCVGGYHSVCLLQPGLHEQLCVTAHHAQLSMPGASSLRVNFFLFLPLTISPCFSP